MQRWQGEWSVRLSNCAQKMNDSGFSNWWEVAKYIGAGATFVLGIVVWKLWPAYQSELQYSKQRDRETLDILSALTKVVQGNDLRATEAQREVLAAIERLSDTIHTHFNKKAGKV